MVFNGSGGVILMHSYGALADASHRLAHHSSRIIILVIYKVVNKYINRRRKNISSPFCLSTE